MTPPFFAMARIMSSVMFRRAFDSARHDEWDAKIGAWTRLESIPEGVVRHMRDIDNHAESVHLLDYVAPQGVQAPMMLDLGVGDVARGVRPVIRVRVCQSHVANTGIIEFTQDLQAVLNRVTAFQSDQRRDLSRASALTMSSAVLAKTKVSGVPRDDVVSNRIDDFSGVIGGVF